MNADFLVALFTCYQTYTSRYLIHKEKNMGFFVLFDIKIAMKQNMEK